METKKETAKANDKVANEEQAKKAAPAVKQGPKVAKVSERRAKATAAEQIDPEEKIESALGRTEQFLYNNGKNLLTGLTIAVLVVILFLGYKYLYMANRAEKAGAAMFVAEQLFADDSFETALNGDGNNAGFLEIADKYGATPQGNIARHYAGVCYLKLNDLDNAATYLAKYKTTKGAPNEIINAQNIGLQGDIFVQKGDYNKAAEAYRKAVSASDNSFTAPYYLHKLALVYDKLGKAADAQVVLNQISEQYPSSMEGRDVQKRIGAEEQK